MKKFLKSYRLLFVGIGIITFVRFVLGLTLSFVPTGSMEPVIPVESVCLISTHVRYEDLKIGDIIVYLRETDNMHIIHRVIEITPDGIVTKGDANQSDDGVCVTADNLYGRYIGHIHSPLLVQLYMFLHDFLVSPYGICIIFGLVAFLFISDIVDLIRHRS